MGKPGCRQLSQGDQPGRSNEYRIPPGYISSDPTDPWGHKYLVNVAALGTVAQPVWVISAGPNGILETAISNTGTAAPEVVAGDDIGFRIQ